MKHLAKIFLWLVLGTGLLNAASSTNQPLVVNTNTSRIANFTNFWLANTNWSVPVDSLFFAPLLHTHTAADITSGTIDPARLGSGASISTKYLRGDSTWQTITTGSGDALVANPLSQFAATTSAQLRGVISDETGTGAAVFGTSPSLTTPSIGAATAASINGTTIPSSKTLVVTTDTLSVHAATTSSQLAGVVSDETGSGSLVFATSPALTTPDIGVATATSLNFGTSVFSNEAANSVSVRNGVNPQSYRIYNTYTDASNYERAALEWSANNLYLRSQNAGTGTSRAVVVDGSSVYLSSGGTLRWNVDGGGVIKAQTDNAYDIGASGANRPRNGYFGTSVVTPAATVSNLTLTGAISFPAGVRQTFAPNTTTPGFNVGSVASDPSSLSNGDLWLQSTTGRLRTRVGGASVDVATGAQPDYELTTVTSGATIAIDLNANQYQTLSLATDATTVTTSNRSATKGRAVTLLVLASGAQRTFTLNGSWRNYNGGSTSVVIPSGKEAAFSFFCTGSAETDVRVSYTVQP